MSLKHHDSGSAFPEIKKGTLRLYSMKLCPFAERTRLILAHKKNSVNILNYFIFEYIYYLLTSYESININLKNPPEWFNKLYPAGEVPVLQHDDGRLLSESLIIIEYLDAIFPQNSVTPKDAFKKAKRQILIGSVSDILSGF